MNFSDNFRSPWPRLAISGPTVAVSISLLIASAVLNICRLGQAAPPGKKNALQQTVGVLSIQFHYERTDKVSVTSDGASDYTTETWEATGHLTQRVTINPTGEVPGSMAFSVGQLPANDPSPGGNKQAEYSGIHTLEEQSHSKDGSSMNMRRFGNFDIQSSDESNPDAIHVSMFSAEAGDNQCIVRFLVHGNYTEKTQINGTAAVWDRYANARKFVNSSQSSVSRPLDLEAQHEFGPSWSADYGTPEARTAHESSCNLYGGFPQALSASGAKTTYSPKGGWTVTYSLSQKNPNSKTTTLNGGTTTGSGSEKITLVARLVPGNPPPAKMIIAPNDATGYDNWLPIPASDDPAVQKVYGNTDRLSFTATIKAKDQGRVAPTGTIDFYLRNVSHNQGKCGNDPRPGAAGGDSGSPPVGLRFARNQAGVIVDPNDPTHAYTADLVSSAIVVVEATDTGAYGRLYAESQELNLNGVYERTNQLFVPVPRDDDNNHIAYKWEKDHHILGKALAATSDDEDQPFPKHKGDGLSIYDQYRGFVVRGDDRKGNPIKMHQRIDVKSKNVFVRVPEDDLAAAFIRKSVEHFGAVTGFTIHFLYDDTGLGFDDGELGKSPYPHWLNYNADPTLAADGCPRQYAIWVLSKPSPAQGVYGRTVPIPPFRDEDPETPKNVDYIGIFRDSAKRRLDDVIKDYPTIRQVAGINPKWYLGIRNAWDQLHADGKITDDFPAIAKYVSDHETELVDHFMEFTIIHEMSHATGVQHHHLKDALSGPNGAEQQFFAMGNADCPTRYWANDLKLDLLECDGKWNVTNAPDGTAWKFCDDECAPQFHLRD